ncbi:alpha-glucuronidase family glycosyl hydrolase [Paludibaculum fermentans]|uniref:alpha-glucuronidase family glycosyl hydrolase n=1 Tax=Paludibaculum fermentans TaxID=1473598 RepID=UPI003EB6C2E4
MSRKLRWMWALLPLAGLQAETGADAWLRYSALDAATARRYVSALPATVVLMGDSPVERTARTELIRGIKGMLGVTLRVGSTVPADGAIVLGLEGVVRKAAPGLPAGAALTEDGYALSVRGAGGSRRVAVLGGSERGVLYGTFALLRKIAMGEPVEAWNERSVPYAPVRWVNHWDNLDGTIERGYGGRSIFWDKGVVREDLSRVSEYGRLLASLGINGCSINNVNADPRVLTPAYLPQLARIAEAFRPWGVRVVLSVDFGSPQRVGGLATFDPLDAGVAAWWKAKTDELYRAVPDLAGLLLKADSEGRIGPSAYGRTHADAANVIARALKPHGGLFFYRGFVYDHHMDWRNLKNDRARAAYDNFYRLDGQFDDNVVIQIKHGPIDFQVREPASPLFGALEKSNQAIELQVTQEYFGQARQLVFLVPMWKEVLDFDMQAKGAGTPVKALAAGRVFRRPAGGFVGVSNVGLDANWLGNHLSQANLYGFGRLAWNPDLTSQQIASEWTRLTFGADPQVAQTIEALQLKSWRVFENYTGPLGLQTLTDIVGNHYGVSVEASERNGWGQWHRSDEKGAGMDRTVATGTGYAGQYRPAVAQRYEGLATCPDELLLFFHHVPYTHVLHSGKTVIQTLYDLHYEGAASVEGYVRSWRALRGRVDEQRYAEVLAQLEYHAGQAQVWRDAVNNWFRRASGIADGKGRVGQHPGRVEAEAMKLEGYVETPVTPWEGGSGGKGIVCEGATCSASTTFAGQSAWYTLRVQYFDQNNGRARYRVKVGEQVVDEWAAGNWVPSAKIDSSTSTRRSLAGIALRPGDVIRIEGQPEGGEKAGLDYVEVVAERP